jgi:protein required for attachment to host cells
MVDPYVRSRSEGYTTSMDDNGRGPGGSVSGYLDAKTEASREVHRAFVRHLVKLASELAKSQEVHHLVFVAPPHMLGMLRERTEKTLSSHIQRVDFVDDLTWHSLPRIQSALERHGIISGRDFRHDVYRGHGQFTSTR